MFMIHILKRVFPIIKMFELWGATFGESQSNDIIEIKEVNRTTKKCYRKEMFEGSVINLGAG